MKLILRFFLPLFVFCALAGCKPAPKKVPPAQAVAAAMEAERALYFSVKSFSKLTQGLAGVPISACPADFQDAFNAWIDAWEPLADWEKNNLLSGGTEAVMVGAAFWEAYPKSPKAAFATIAENAPAYAPQFAAFEKNLQSARAKLDARVKKYTAPVSK